jgi:hypothetical protein
MKKNTPHKKAQGIKNLQSHSNLLDNAQQSLIPTRAKVESSLCLTEAHALKLSQCADGINCHDAARFGHLSFTARIWDLENKGYVFDKPEFDLIDAVGNTHKNVVFYKFIEWREDMIGCKDKAKAQAALDLAKQLPLFDLEMA